MWYHTTALPSGGAYSWMKKGAANMVTIGMNYRVIERKEDIFENAFNNVVKAMTQIEGHGESQMFRDINDPLHYLIVSQWNSKEAFDTFIASDSFKNIATWGKEQILSERPRHEIYGEPESAAGSANSPAAQQPGTSACPAGAH